jgi:ketosteroid isomerase-like protein
MKYEQIIIAAFNEFTGKNLSRLDEFYSQDAVFMDPITTVKGLKEIKTYYAHAYKHVTSIRFEFVDFVIQDDQVCGFWKMHLAAKRLNGGKEFVVEGVSRMKFNKDGKVNFHRDFLDLGSMVYERLPLFGGVVRKLKLLLKP